MRPHVYTFRMAFDEPGSLRRARDAVGGLSLDGGAVRRAREAAKLTQSEVSSRMLRLDWRLNRPVSMVERNECRLSEAAATALAAVLGVGLSEVLPEPDEQ